jgi:hypothetical protein
MSLRGHAPLVMLRLDPGTCVKRKPEHLREAEK